MEFDAEENASLTQLKFSIVDDIFIDIWQLFAKEVRGQWSEIGRNFNLGYPIAVSSQICFGFYLEAYYW